MMNNNIFSAIVVELNNLNDVQGAQILSIIKGFQSNPSTPATPKTPSLSIPDEKPEPKSNPLPEGKKLYQDDFTTVLNPKDTKEYRLYINCPIAGEKGKKVRYAIKASAKDLGAKFGGNPDTKDFFWVFPTKKAAEEFIKARKNYNKKSA